LRRDRENTNEIYVSQFFSETKTVVLKKTQFISLVYGEVSREKVLFVLEITKYRYESLPL